MKKERTIILYCAGFVILMSIWLITCTKELSSFSIIKLALLIVFSYAAMALDLHTKRIPNMLVLVMVVVWLLLMIPMLFLSTETGLKLLAESIYGLLIGGGLFLLVYLLSRKGLGGGDVKFMAAAGLYLGLTSTVSAILYGTILAALTGSVLILLRKIGRKDTIPLVPFLFAGIMITTFTY